MVTMKNRLGVVARHLIFVSVLCVWLLPSAGAETAIPAEQENYYRIGLTPVFLADKTSFLNEWRRYLESKLGSPVQFIQRQTYQEVTNLLLSGGLDAAWLCGYPYVTNRDSFKLLGIPLYKGQPFYQSYLIVPNGDRDTGGIEDLKNKVFVYSDPNSNSGFLYPQVYLLEHGIQPRTFFKKTFFAWSHKDVVKAVAEGVADAGSVDGYVWETIARDQPGLTSKTRVVKVSRPFGFPPFVVKKEINAQLEAALQSSLLHMNEDPVGRGLLAKLNLDGFVRGEDAFYQSIEEMVYLFRNNQ